MEAVAKGTLLCGHIRALVTRFKRGAPHLRFMRTHSFPLVQGGYALTEAAESVCREQCTGAGFHQKSQLKAASSSLLQPLVFDFAPQVQDPSERWTMSSLAQRIFQGCTLSVHCRVLLLMFHG